MVSTLPSSSKSSDRSLSLTFSLAAGRRRGRTHREGMLESGEIPEAEDELLSSVTLTQDKKYICRTTSYNLPLKGRYKWEIIYYKSRKEFSHLDLPRCQLRPEPQDPHQEKEWELFINYLQSRQKVAVVKFKGHEFYIFAAIDQPELSHAIVMYKMRESIQRHNEKEFGGSGSVSLEKMLHYDPSRHMEEINDYRFSNDKATTVLKKQNTSSYTRNDFDPSNIHAPCLDLSQAKNPYYRCSTGKDVIANRTRQNGNIYHTSEPRQASMERSPSENILHYDPSHHMEEEINDNRFSNAKATGILQKLNTSSHTRNDFGPSNIHAPSLDRFQAKLPYYGCSTGKDSNANCATQKGNIYHTSEPRNASMERSPSESVADVTPPVSMMMDLPKNFVRTDPSYLRTLGQAHAGWIFGAIAELVDNSRDANATRLDIFIECLYLKKAGEKVPVFSIIDNGHGMCHAEITRMLSFGHKQPDEKDPQRIGRFGIGFKTGAMRLGRDALVLTQTSNSRSVALLSQSYNKDKEILEIPTVTYCKKGKYMEVDLSIQSDAEAGSNLNAIKEFSPFNEYLIGEKLGIFGDKGTGTQIYIWNLDRWGSDYSLVWTGEKIVENTPHKTSQDISIRSGRVRSRPGQISQKVPLDYSLQAYLEVIFLNPRMKIYVQGSLVKCRPLAKSLSNTVPISGQILGKTIQLTLGRSKVEWERMNCGIFLYWHGRLIEAYKRVGEQIHNADVGRGVVGVVDVTNLMNCENGDIYVHNNKQGFQDCEVYAKLEEWLATKANDYWDKNFDTLVVRKGDQNYKPDHEWVQCNKCRKWRILESGFDSKSLPPEWFCCMSPFHGNCEIPEQEVARDVITISAKRSSYGIDQNATQSGEAKLQNNVKVKENIAEQSAGGTKDKKVFSGGSEENLTQPEDLNLRPILKRLRRGPRCGRQS